MVISASFFRRTHEVPDCHQMQQAEVRARPTRQSIKLLRNELLGLIQQNQNSFRAEDLKATLCTLDEKIVTFTQDSLTFIREMNLSLQRESRFSYNGLISLFGFGSQKKTVKKIQNMQIRIQNASKEFATSQVEKLSQGYLQGQIDGFDAIGLYEKLLKLIPNNSALTEQMAYCLLNEGAYRQALQIYDTTNTKPGEDLELHLRRCKVHMHLGSYDKARQQIGKLIHDHNFEQEEPGIKRVLYKLEAHTYILEKNYDAAIKIFRNLLIEDTNDEESKKRLVLCSIENDILKASGPYVKKRYFLASAMNKFIHLGASSKNMYFDDTLLAYFKFWLYVFLHSNQAQKGSEKISHHKSILTQMRDLIESSQVVSSEVVDHFCTGLEQFEKVSNNFFKKFNRFCDNDFDESHLSTYEKAVLQARRNQLKGILFGNENELSSIGLIQAQKNFQSVLDLFKGSLFVTCKNKIEGAKVQLEKIQGNLSLCAERAKNHVPTMSFESASVGRRIEPARSILQIQGL